ncbi:RHS repeat-associated core domain-containing protein [Curtobacterium sp. MCBD17_040]|uniref:RHS repeat-associated core domain-containing protein n=1 Tax=Curtobacterium sp. MCBD17_040 TaxID=2175674 RepID=UPI0011B5FD48|nr:RHS repeat-associated core domain-containing protein [Curtobacterium sp. MCBD17_040]WIB63333.1 RHS repeat-associated core domain-containing protein [Curtobacterium sp. MCBD17_040]
MDTRSGTGGYSTAMPAGGYRSIQVGGKAGVPTSGVGAVVVNVTAVNMTQQGEVRGRPDDSTASALMLVFDGGGLGTTSNTATIAVGDDGTIQVASDVVTDLVIDVQGYYTANDDGTAAGGFVSVPGTRIVDSRNGTGVSKAQIAAGSSVTFQVTGNGGVPAGASAVVANFIVIPAANGGYITPYPAGTSKPQRSLQYAAGVPTSLTAQVALSSDGKLTVADDVNAIDLAVDVQGYFTATNGGGSVFTPAAGTVYDTRVSPNTPIAANSSRAIQVSGQAGVPAVGAGVTAVALTLTSLHAANSTGDAIAWADGATKPGTTSINFSADSIRTNTVIVPVGSNGKIDLYNRSGDSTDYVFELQGWYNNLPTGPTTTNVTGSRPSATNLSFGIDDQTSAQVDVATGNLLVGNSGLSLPGVNASTTIGAAYNSRGWQTASSIGMVANRWQYALDGVGSLSAGSTGVIYTGPDGSTWLFKVNADGSYTTPAGLQQTLAKSSAEYTLTSWTSKQVDHFNLNGQPTKVVDGNSNAVAFSYSGATLASIVSTAGAVTTDSSGKPISGARVANVAYSNGATTFTQTNGSATRSIRYSKDGNGNIVGYTDATGATTTFGYSGQDLTSVTAPNGGVTTFTYDSSDRVTEVDQRNTTAGSPGTAVTRLSYVSSTQTQVAGPDTDSSQTVSAVKNTTYTIDASTHDVTKAVDPDGNTRSASYNAANNAVSQSQVGSGDSTSTTTGTYTSNSGQSLDKVASSSGASSSATYGDSTNPYLPTSTTDGSGNTTTVTYNGQGNQMTSSTGSDTNVQAAVERNSDGTVKTATAPGNAASGSTPKNPTTYAYDGNHQLSTVTPPTGTTLGVKTYTYDAFGRLASETDGNSHTTSFTYDNDDRQLTESFSDGTHAVSNQYDGNGNLTSSTSATGTITNTYDQQNRLTSTVNTAGGGTVSYTYDKASNELTVSAGGGTATNTYDPANTLLTTTLPNASGTETQVYATDDHGRRTDTWVNANAAHTTWTGRTHTDYDTSGRVIRVRSWTGTGDASNSLVFDTSYCYQFKTASASCDSVQAAKPTAASQLNDRSELQLATDNISHQTTTYGYTAARLTSATQAGGSSNVTWTYSYNSNGDRTGAAETGSATSSQNLTYNAANQITSSGYTYDAAGNMTASPGVTYTYNGAEQMTSSTMGGKTTTYTYAGADQNELLSQTTPGGDSYMYVYGKSGQLQSQTSAGQTSFFFDDPTTGQVLDAISPDLQVGLYLVDGIGSPVGILTDDGQRAYAVSFDPYGNRTVVSGGTSPWFEYLPFGYKSGIRITGDGLVKFGQRWYLPVAGGWTQEDTLDAPLDPGNANRYAFVGCDPINGSDPTGRVSQCGHAVTGLVFSSLGLIASGVAIVGSVAAEIPSLGWSTALGVAGVIGFGASAYGVIDGIGSVASAC